MIIELKVALPYSTDSRIVKFDMPDELGESLRKSFESIVGMCVTCLTMPACREDMLEFWKEAVERGKTELGFEEWRKVANDS